MQVWSVLSLLFLTVLNICKCQMISPEEISPTVPSVNEADTQPIHARQAWIKADKDLKSAVNKLVRKAMPTLMKEIYKKEVSSPCLGSLMGFVKAFKESKLWAYEMIDAAGKLPEGFLRGSLSALGNYDECVDIKVDEAKLKLRGQYCTLNLEPPLPKWKPFTSAHLTMPEVMNVSAPDTVITYLMGIIHNLHITSIKLGICTPSKCSKNDVDKLVDIIPEQLGMNWKFVISRCEVKNEIEFTEAQFIVLYIIGAVSLLVIFGTIIDKIYSSEDMEISCLKSTLFHVAKSFSFLANAKKLSDYTYPQREVSFVYGIVVFMFAWNVMANTFMYVNYDVASNFVEALNILKHVFYEVALNRILPLQTLFYLSGFLTTYRYIKSPESGLNIIKFFAKKFFRYTLAYGLLLALIILTPTWGSGPSWFAHMDPMYRYCRDNWWHNILYINNYTNPETTCLSHTWVFAVAAQLHVISIFILIPLKLRPKIGLMINLFLAVASLASVALTNVYYDLPPNEMAAILDEKDRNFYAGHSYYRVYTHVCIYCTGVFIGYLMAKYPNLKISTKASCFLWIVTGTGLLSALCVVHEWRLGHNLNPLLAALYTTFSKVAQAAFLAWVTVACMTGHSGGAKDILGWRPLAFFARLTFIAYFMHVPIINMVMNFKKSPIYICELEIFYIVLSHAAGTYIVSYPLYMFFEAPWISLTDVLRRSSKGKTFNSELPITEKPVKYCEKAKVADKNLLSVNSIENSNVRTRRPSRSEEP